MTTTCVNSSLTASERRIVILLRAGMTNREIGESLQISEQDAKNRIRSICDKWGVDNRLQIAVRGATWSDNPY